jgi:hypothetical protein
MIHKLKLKLNIKSVIHRPINSREFYVDLSKAVKREAKHQISCVGMRVILKTDYCITDRVFLFNGIHSVQEEIGAKLH